MSSQAQLAAVLGGNLAQLVVLADRRSPAAQDVADGVDGYRTPAVPLPMRPSPV